MKSKDVFFTSGYFPVFLTSSHSHQKYVTKLRIFFCRMISLKSKELLCKSLCCVGKHKFWNKCFKEYMGVTCAFSFFPSFSDLHSLTGQSLGSPMEFKTLHGFQRPLTVLQALHYTKTPPSNPLLSFQHVWTCSCSVLPPTTFQPSQTSNLLSFVAMEPHCL